MSASASYKFDNTNYVGSGYSYGSNYDVDRLPLEDNYELLRRYLWLAIDRAYKSAVEAISRKRAALKNVSVSEQPDDFAKADPVQTHRPGHRRHTSTRRAGRRSVRRAVGDLRQVSALAKFVGGIFRHSRHPLHGDYRGNRGAAAGTRGHAVGARLQPGARRHDAARRGGLPFRPPPACSPAKWR